MCTLTWSNISRLLHDIAFVALVMELLPASAVTLSSSHLLTL